MEKLVGRTKLLTVCLLPKREKSPRAVEFCLPFSIKIDEDGMRQTRARSFGIREVN